MGSIQSLSDIPDFARIEARHLLSSIKSLKEEPQNITGKTHRTPREESDFINLDPYDEENDEDEKIPSDLSTHHHPQRIREYTLTFTDSFEKKLMTTNLSVFIVLQMNIDGPWWNVFSTWLYVLEYCSCYLTKHVKEEDTTEVEDTSELEWVLDGVCLSDLCLNFKTASSNLAKRTDPDSQIFASSH
ncbi:hypothetical protein BDF20DRAFT_918030 [Mycotypha africana]|uniref:uncharacterized protein n=1 Tax=Mycotypha africana TaxID=64632 RepID=UPI002301906C|nr:uncharacterized protein BDF20DRAFT_918030 [Mycotypha africana]KAI8966942.1 hypothetical protein BDF20DRAFT_918030 [Mycotypha africana]